MTKKTLWYVCLGLLCCGMLAYSVSAKLPGKSQIVNPGPAMTGKSAPATPLKAADPVALRLNQLTTVSTGKAGDVAALEAEIASLEGQINSSSNMAQPVSADLKYRLNELYALRPVNHEMLPITQGNDACPATVIAALPYTDTGTTAGMVNDWNTANCTTTAAPDVIYSYTPAASALVTVSLCGSTYDSDLEIRSGGACPGTTQVACNDDFCGLQSQVQLSMSAGVTYFIIVDGYSSNSGAYTLNVTAAAPCVITCQGGDIQEVAEPTTPDSTNMASDPNGGCNNTSGNFLFSTINCGQTVCGRAFTYTRPSGAQIRDTDGYHFTIAERCTVTWSARAEFPVALFILDAGCPWVTTYASATNANICSTTVATAVCLPPGTYTAWIGPNVFTGVPVSRYRATLTCSAPCAPCTPDLTINAPATITDNSCGAVDNCNLRAGEDKIYRVNIPTAGNWTFTMCDTTGQGANFDTYMYLTDACCGGTLISSNDDGCGYVGRSRITCQALSVGTYWLDIEPFSNGACGAYRLQVVMCEPCVITCQPGDVIEPTENFADTTFYRTDPTGGCNSTPAHFGAVNCGQTVCGIGSTYLGPGGAQYRDTDWYLFTTTQPETIKVKVKSEFPSLFGIVTGVSPCGTVSFLASATTTLACDSGTVQAICLAPGTYAMFVAPNVFTGVTNLHYRATLTCSAPCAPCTPDFTINAPGTVDGTTCGAGDNCSLRAGEDLIIRINIPTTGEYSISLCNSPAPGFDTYMMLTSTCCGGTTVASDDDGCGYPPGLSSLTCQQLTAGTYYLDVEPFNSTVCGPINVAVTTCAPCDITQQPGDVVECTETWDDNMADNDCDGGCNDVTPTYTDVTNGETIFGITGTYVTTAGDNRDTDWFRFSVTCSTDVVWSTISEVAANIFLLDITDCANVTLIAQGVNTGHCDTAAVTARLAPGTWCAWIGPTVFTGVPQSNYRGTISWTPCFCDSARDVTVLINPANTHNWVHFTAPLAGNYDIYSTTDRTTEYPNNFVLEATVVATAGTNVWTDNGALVPYKRYTVIHRC